MSARAAAAGLYALLAVGVAVAAPLRLLPRDAWRDAARAVRAEAQPRDLVVLAPAAQVGRLPDFGGLWAVSIDPATAARLDAFPRVFYVEGNGSPIPPIAAHARMWTRRFGPVTVTLFSPAPR
jgi:hypothetical protein